MLISGGSYRFKIFQDAAGATGVGSEIECTAAANGGMIALVLQAVISNTATVTWQGTVDGTNWVAIQAENLADGTKATTTTASGLFRVIAHGLTKFRANITSWSSGTVTVKGNLVA